MVLKYVLSGVALLLTGCAAGTSAPRPAQIDGVIGAAVEERQVPAAVAMVATREGIAYEEAVGLPGDALFAIGSMTKPVTAVAVMQLVEAGRVELDVPAHAYVPELRDVHVLEDGGLRPPASPPTVRQLLTHTSGFAYEFLHRELAGQVEAGRVESRFAGTGEFLHAPLVADPGDRWVYGISMDWLGRLVETVTGSSLDVYFRTHIFEPLGMRDTYFDVPPQEAERVAPLHGRQPDGDLAVLPRPLTPVEFLSGGGGLYTTAADYLRFTRALLADGALDGRRILRPETVAMMTQNQIGDLRLPPFETMNPDVFSPAVVAMPGGVDAYGLGIGFNREPLASGREAGTLAWAGIFNTFFWIDRETGLTAVLFVQMRPFGDPDVLRLVEAFEAAVYQVYG